MLKPAICYREQLFEKFAKEIYTDRYFYYSGYPHAHNLPDIQSVTDQNKDGIYQYAIVNSEDIVIGWLAYRIYTDTNSVENFGLYSFEDEDYSLMKNAVVLGKDVHNKLKELASQYHRISWRVISGNPVERSYDKLCKELNGNKVTLHDITVDNYGKYHDEHIYEVINDNI